MPKLVEVPGVGTVEFPDAMSEEEIGAALQATPPAPAPVVPARTTAQRIVRSSAPSIIGGAVGAGVGGVVAGLTGGTGAVTIPSLTALGAGLGEAVQQFYDPLGAGTDTENPSFTQIGLATALPLVPSTIRAGLTRLPGAAGGLQEVAVGTARQLPALLKPAESADKLFTAIRQANPRIPTAPLKAALDTAVANEAQLAKALQDTTVRKAIAGARFLTESEAGPITAVNFISLHANMKRVGALIDQAEKKGGDIERVVKTVYRGFRESIDAAAGATGGQTGALLTRANTAFKHELAVEKLTKILDAHIKHAGKAIPQLSSANTVLDDLAKHGDEFADLVGPEGLTEVRRVLVGLTTVPIIPTTQTIGSGGVQFGTRTIASFALGHIGGELLGTPGAASGAVSILAVEAISNMLLTAPGRAIIRTLVQRGTPLSQIANISGQALRGTLNDQQARDYLTEGIMTKRRP